jgi:hypothetical protein
MLCKSLRYYLPAPATYACLEIDVVGKMGATLEYLGTLSKTKETQCMAMCIMSAAAAASFV